MDGSHNSLDAELASFPAELVGEAKLRASLGDREAQSLTAEEKVCCNHPLRRAFFSHVLALLAL